MEKLNSNRYKCKCHNLRLIIKYENVCIVLFLDLKNSSSLLSAENMPLDLLSIVKFKMRAKTPAEVFNLKLEFAMPYCGKYLLFKM